MQLPSNSHRKLEYPNNRIHALHRKMIHNKHSSTLVSHKSIKISGKPRKAQGFTLKSASDKILFRMVEKHSEQ